MNALRVTAPFPLSAAKTIAPSDNEVNVVVATLMVVYDSLPITVIYGRKNVDYICHMSVRYAFWTLPSSCEDRSRAVTGHAMWLSLVWIIDGAVDKGVVDPSYLPLIYNKITEVVSKCMSLFLFFFHFFSASFCPSLISQSSPPTKKYTLRASSSASLK